jgi:hypothetical protein
MLPDEGLTRVLRRMEIGDADSAPIERVFTAVDRERRSQLAARRRQFLGLMPWPGSLVRRAAVVVAMVAAVVAVVVATGILARMPGVGGPQTPSASPAPTSAPVTTFVSPIYGYTIQYPAAWGRRDAERVLSGTETPWESSPAVDRMRSSDQYAILIVGAARVEPGTTLDGWTTSTTIVTCGEPTNRAEIEIDGGAGWLLTYDRCNSVRHQWVTVLHGTSAWHIIWLGASPTNASARAQFLQVLGTFRFPEGPLPTPASS